MRCQRLVMTFEQTLLKWQLILEKPQFFPAVQYCILTLYTVSLWVSFSFVNSTQQSTAILHSGGKVLLQPNWLFLLHGNYLPRNTTVEGQIAFNKKIQLLGFFLQDGDIALWQQLPLLLRLKLCCSEQTLCRLLLSLSCWVCRPRQEVCSPTETEREG